MAGPWDNDPIVSAPASAKPWEADPIASSALKQTAVDVAKSGGAGLAKGTIGLAGLPGAIEDATNWLGRQSVGRVGNYMRGEGFTAPSFQDVETRRAAMGLGSQKALPSAEGMQKAVEGVTGEFYKPQTVAGQYAGTIGEFLPGMALPGGSFSQRAAQAVIPAVASETAGQVTAGTSLEPYARAAAGVGTGLGVAGVQALSRQPVNRVLQGATGPSLNRQAVDSAAQLMDDAAARGVTLTWDEALAQVTGNRVNLGGIRSGAESRPEGAALMRDAMAQRAGQVEGAARQQFGQIAPVGGGPFGIGPQIGEAAGGLMTDTRKAINAASDPLYKQAEQVRISPQEFAKAQAAPGWKEASAAVRNNPQLSRYVQGMPDDSVGFLKEVKKFLDIASENAAGPMNAQRNQQIAAGYGQDATLVRQTAEAASPEYAQALAFQSQARERFLKPLQEGLIGRLAAKDITTEKAMSALFPANPLAGSANEISGTMTALVQRNPTAAKQLVRTYAETTFDQAARDLISGSNPNAGAKFSVAIKGNSQQAQNLEAAVKALPQGDDIWNGFNRFLDIVEATGKAPAMGSNTANKLAVQEQMKSGGVVGEIANAVSTGGIKIPGKLKSWYEQLQGGKNSQQIASILLDPNSVGIFRALANEKTGVPQSLGLATRLTFLGERTTAERSPQPSR
jgi:hypothetical protein